MKICDCILRFLLSLLRVLSVSTRPCFFAASGTLVLKTVLMGLASLSAWFATR